MRRPSTWQICSLGVALDEVAPSNPVLLFAWWGHGAIVNSRCLTRAFSRPSADAPQRRGRPISTARPGSPTRCRITFPMVRSRVSFDFSDAT